MKSCYDIAVIGSGFAGSILSRILADQGRSVLLVDAATHPRFAIGESSTPLADLMLRRIGQQYGFRDLESMSCYGSWQRDLPELPCGLKRGFSYFDHREGGRECRESFFGERSLVVAASPSDERSDTHWYRPEVDHHLFKMAAASGVETRQGIQVIDVLPGNPNRIVMSGDCVVDAQWVVDCTGASGLTARLRGVQSYVDSLSTNTCASFAHFRDVASFSKQFDELHGDDRAMEPFDADNAAQHHLIDGGWVWMLRLNLGITSVGCVLDNRKGSADQARQSLESRFRGYPMLHRIMRDAIAVAPASGPVTAKRLQRFWDPVVDDRILMAPTTSLTLDPLHSTGIAHAMVGIERLANILLHGASVDQYREAMKKEARFLDQLVSAAYGAMASFERFSAACMLYFAAAINCEETLIAGEVPEVCWNGGDLDFATAVERATRCIEQESDDATVTKRVRELIQPWNVAGLLDETVQNRYRYTATK